MASITQSFDRIETAIATIIQGYQRSEEEWRETKKIIANHAIYISNHERDIDKLNERVEYIEKQA